MLRISRWRRLFSIDRSPFVSRVTLNRFMKDDPWRRHSTEPRKDIHSTNPEEKVTIFSSGRQSLDENASKAQLLEKFTGQGRGTSAEVMLKNPTQMGPWKIHHASLHPLLSFLISLFSIAFPSVRGKNAHRLVCTLVLTPSVGASHKNLVLNTGFLTV